jgi:RNA polymerase sigma factor (sigma-70 family)
MGENDRGEAFAAGLERGARAVAKFHPGAGCSLRTWFSNAARHGIQDELRIQGNRRGWSRHRGQVVQMLSLDRFSAESEEGGEWFGREEPGFEEVESKLLLPRLAARLTETEREVLRLYFVEELTHPEIGKRFGFSESRACQIKVRAVNKLRDQLDREAS